MFRSFFRGSKLMGTTYCIYVYTLKQRRPRMRPVVTVGKWPATAFRAWHRKAAIANVPSQMQHGFPVSTRHPPFRQMQHQHALDLQQDQDGYGEKESHAPFLQPAATERFRSMSRAARVPAGNASGACISGYQRKRRFTCHRRSRLESQLHQGPAFARATAHAGCCTGMSRTRLAVARTWCSSTRGWRQRVRWR